MSMQHTSGIVIVATGHPYYGRMAFNLAKSIKAVDRQCAIQVITDASALDHIGRREMWVFDYVTSAPAQNGFNLKLRVNDLCLFDRFILIDADCAWVSPQSPLVLIDKLAQLCEFTAITEGYHDYDAPSQSDTSGSKYYFWADKDDIRDKYELSGKIYQWRSEFMFVKKGALADDLFGSAQYVYDHAYKLKGLKLFADHIPDELAINIAACVHGIGPHQYKWRPTFWHRMHGESIESIEHLQADYYALSCGSNVTSRAAKVLYDRIVKAASYKLGMQHVFPMTNKREMMPLRQKM